MENKGQIFVPKMASKKQSNKDENVHRFALTTIKGELLERESFGILYTGYILSIVKIKREI